MASLTESGRRDDSWIGVGADASVGVGLGGSMDDEVGFESDDEALADSPPAVGIARRGRYCSSIRYSKYDCN